MIQCDVLVTTLAMMSALLVKRLDGFNLYTVKMLVFVNMHNMTQPTQSLQEVLLYFDQLHKKQVIVTSKSWRPAFKKLFNDLMTPVICFGSAIEVAFKENTALVIKIAKSSDEQLKQLLELIRQSVASKARTAIVCNSADHLALIQTALTSTGIEFYLLGGECSLVCLAITKYPQPAQR